MTEIPIPRPHVGLPRPAEWTRRAFMTRGLAATAGMSGVLTPGVLPRPAGSPAAPANPVPEPSAEGVVNWLAHVGETVRTTERSLRTPFTLGVASGDPHPQGVVLWTRLAPEPFEPDGLGGMPAGDVDVEWQIAEDPTFGVLAGSGKVTARASSAHSVHVEPSGLRPGREYFYRFRAGGHLSGVGRTRTAPAARSAAPLHVAGAPCSNFEQGHFTAYRRLAESQPDLVCHLGDYIYEFPSRAAAAAGTGRAHLGPRTTTLAGYRARHAQYKADPDLAAAHAAAPWMVAYDDHEVADNWAGDIPALPEDRAKFRRIRTAALQAYYENMPLSRASLPAGGHLQLFRRLTWGRVATLHVLDTRQYRDEQSCTPRFTRAPCAARLGEDRSILGHRQEAWLAAGFRGSRSVWDLLTQQVFFSPNLSSRPPRGPGNPTIVGVNMDSWDGYPANRLRLLADARSGGVDNLVVLTGDVHSAWAGEIRAGRDLAGRTPLGVELVTTSISSGGDGAERTGWGSRALAMHPHLKFFDGRRGWLAVRCTTAELRADFNVLPYVTRPGALATKAATFVVGAGQHRLAQR